MKTYTGKDATLTIQPYMRVSHQFVGGGSLDRTLIGEDDSPLITAEGFTLVNLLGSYGSFSKDNNGDGLADGGNPIGYYTPAGTFDHSTFVEGTCSQKLIQPADGHTARWYLGVDTIIPQHKYYISGYAMSDTVNPTNSYVSAIVNAFTDRNIIGVHNGTFVTGENIWIKFFKTYTTQIYDQNLYFGINCMAYNYFWQDAFTIYDLTWMDQHSPMPQALKDKYAITKWVDMVDNDLVVELPYVDGVGYVGVGL